MTKTAYEKHDIQMMQDHAGSIFQRAQDRMEIPLESRSTGSLVFDIATGIGGIGVRNSTQLWGLPKKGKTATALSCVAQASRKGKTHFIDAELKMPQEYFDEVVLANGGDLNNAVLVRPFDGAHIATILEGYIGWDDVIVVDSIAAIFPPKMLAHDDPAHVFMGSQAKFIGDMFGRMRFSLGHCGLGREDLPNGTAVLFTNQARANYKAPPNSDGLKPFGGYGQAHGLSVSMKLGGGKVNKERTGSEVSCWVTENQLAPPKARGVTYIKFGMGIDLGQDTLIAGVQMGFIEKSGSFYKLNGGILGQGKPRAGDALVAMGWDDLYRLRDEIREAILEGKEEQDGNEAEAVE